MAATESTMLELGTTAPNFSLPDLQGEVVCTDDDHLLEVLNRRIRAIPGVRDTEAFVYLKLRKQIYSWGTR